MAAYQSSACCFTSRWVAGRAIPVDPLDLSEFANSGPGRIAVACVIRGIRMRKKKNFMLT